MNRAVRNLWQAISISNLSRPSRIISGDVLDPDNSWLSVFYFSPFGSGDFLLQREPIKVADRVVVASGMHDHLQRMGAPG
jgi:hypothetical protein